MPGSKEARRRLKILLATLTGEKTVVEACSELGIGESRFHDLRNEFLNKGVEALDPRPLGRPPAPEPTELEKENLRLHRELSQLKLELQGSLIREEIALTMPHLLKPSKGKKTKEGSSRVSSKRGPGGSCATKRSSGASGGSTT
jgi:hypothetical protein